MEITLVICYNYRHAPVAQWIEYLASNQGVVGSNPAGCTKVFCMKIDFPVPTDDKIHRYCLDCKSDGVVFVEENGNPRQKCTTCGKVNDRSIQLRKGEYWIDKNQELWHRSVGIFIKDGDKYLFSQRRFFPLGLAIPSGHIDAGETPENAASRELFEETGLNVPLRLLFKTDIPGDCCCGGADFHQWHVFLGEVNEPVKVTLSDESKDAGWFTLDGAMKTDVPFAMRFLIENFKIS